MRSPEPIVAPVGDDVVFECSLNVPAEAVRWRHNGAYLNGPGTMHDHDHAPHNQPLRPSATSRLVVKFNDEKQEGDYQCVAWFGASALASTPAKLTLAELQPFLYQAHRHYTVTEGNNVVINCPPPVSKPAAIIQYRRNDQLLPPESNPVLQTTGSLLLTNVTEKDNGIYTCSATNYITGLIIDSPLRVTLAVIKPAEPVSPRFLYNPQPKYTIQAGQNVSLECSGVGTPPPNVTWRRVIGALPTERAELRPGALRLTNVQPSDNGQYVCELSNGIPPMVAHLVILEVQVPPNVTKGPSNSVVGELMDTEISCEATGSPTPNITWLLNGARLDDDPHMKAIGGKLFVKRIQKRHAGIYQCFASNPVGVTYGAAIIQVSPIQMPQTPDSDIEDNEPEVTMIPPTRPNITRLSDKSVMVRWSVPVNNGLPIEFFKVQYQDLDVPGARWMTSNEDIQPHIRVYEVDGLTTDHHYRFRIAAVYDNKDNKLGRSSVKFHLSRGSPYPKTPLDPPTLTEAKPLGPTEIKIHWEYLNSVLVPVDGFYVYYRPRTSAADYIKATVEGQNARSFVISHLQPDTMYDIKLQSFTVGEASAFSAIVAEKTLKPPNTSDKPPEVTKGPVMPGDKVSHGQLYLVLGAVIAGLALLFTLAGAICICYRRSSSHEDHNGVESCDKSGAVEPGLTIQQLEPVTMNGFAHNGKINGRVGNGFHPRSMNITNNPLAETDHHKNVMELTYMTNQNNNCSSDARSDIDDELDHTKRRGKTLGQFSINYDISKHSLSHSEKIHPLSVNIVNKLVQKCV
ncbi:unnamed protein product [Nesidiocoris tenuis]|uniref:Interference hedgehog n=1 Tax=Nesidiocoris tenuis TaxID=355587 RepID=A0A6H5H0R5_9HEMI|nr:unnamed protein product [Nesidiocoris tenuis]CAB0010165.1 unnamed protein product [Nesidiocoris tenuis]